MRRAAGHSTQAPTLNPGPGEAGAWLEPLRASRPPPARGPAGRRWLGLMSAAGRGRDARVRDLSSPSVFPSMPSRELAAPLALRIRRRARLRCSRILRRVAGCTGLSREQRRVRHRLVGVALDIRGVDPKALQDEGVLLL